MKWDRPEGRLPGGIRTVSAFSTAQIQPAHPDAQRVAAPGAPRRNMRGQQGPPFSSSGRGAIGTTCRVYRSPVPAQSSRAVFLSYASQDAEAVRRLAEAMRASGIEVWFEESELLGGDAWDQKIRGQIKECALFVPVISANTNARREGYFRREWKLAVDRTHDMDE